MVEIYSYDVTSHERFAKDQEEIEAFRKQYHVPPSGAGIIAIQTKILDFVPKHSAIVLLMQTFQRKMWAGLKFPKNFHLQRFRSSHVAPSLGSSEKQTADVKRLEAYLKQKTNGRFVRKEKKDQENQPEDQEIIEEGETLINLLEKGVLETNEMVDYAYGRMHQFVQA